MRKFGFKFSAAVAVGLLLSSCGSSSSGGSSGSTGDSAKLSTGFANNCASCHGTAGGGGSGSNLQGYSKSTATFISTVRSGKGSMPSTSSSAYSDTDATADVTYLKSL